MNFAAPQRTDARDPIVAARSWLDEYDRVALATVASAWGSAPVPIGGQLVIAPGDRFEGSVSGGCVEIDVITEAADVMAAGRPKLLTYGIAEETAWRAGISCGGTIKVLLEPLGRGDIDFLDRVWEARRMRQALAVVTNVTTGARQVFDEGASLPPEVAECIAKGTGRLIETPEGGRFVQPFLPPVRVVIAGATHTGQVLADLTRRIGYEAIVVDPRVAFTAEERFGVAQTISAWPAISLPAVGLDARTAVVALTHAAHIDDEALATALRSPCVYIGALGSKRTHAKRLQRLKDAGFSDSDLARIHAPVGLDIGAQGPAEIAVSILAEIVQVARGRG
jgi:xanthine dehydrogenase accessory factor